MSKTFRSRLQICYEILHNLSMNSKGIRHTSLTRVTNLSDELLKDKIIFMSELNLIRKEQDERSITYFITDEGFHLLEICNDFKDTMEEEFKMDMNFNKV